MDKQKDNLMEGELTDMINHLQDVLQERGYDYLMVVAERTDNNSSSPGQPFMGMSSICCESVYSSLVSVLLGVMQKSHAHRRFVAELVHFLNSRRMIVRPNRSRKNDEEISN